VYVDIDKIGIEAQVGGSGPWRSISPVDNGNGQVQGALQSAWVGQAVNLRAERVGLCAVSSLPADWGYSWTITGTAVGGWSGDIKASHKTPVEDELTRPSPTICWVGGGIQQVTVAVTPMAGAVATASAVSASGNVAINRPVANATSETDRVRAFTRGAARYVQFGFSPEDLRIGEEFSYDGIKFTWNRDPKAGGAYQWVQLIDRTTSWTNTDTTTGTWSTGGTVLDVTPNTPFDNYWALRDSPYRDPPGEARANVTDLDIRDAFKTYLMWRYGGTDSPDSIWVPICVTSWDWHGHGSMVDGAWKLTSDKDEHSKDPQSVDTTGYPVWTTNRVDARNNQ